MLSTSCKRSESDHCLPRKPDGPSALHSLVFIVAVGGGSIWAFLFTDLSTLSALPVLIPAAGLVSIMLAVDFWSRLRPWMYWLGAGLTYTALNYALNPSPFTSRDIAHEFFIAVLLGTPVLLVFGRMAVGARVLCGICIVLSLAIWLENNGFELKAGIDDMVGSVRMQIQRNPWNMKYHETWVLFLAWAALAALRPVSRRDWFMAAIVLSVAGLAIASGYSTTTIMVFAISIAAFFVVLWAPRFSRNFSLVALFGFFLGVPLLARIIWRWFMGNADIFAEFVPSLSDKIVSRLGYWEHTSELIGRQPWIGWGLGGAATLPGPPRSLHQSFASWPERFNYSPVEHFLRLGGHPHNFPLLVWVDLGVFGIIFATGFVASLLINTFPTHKGDVGGAARSMLLVAVLLVFCTNYPAWHSAMIFLLVFTGGLAASTMSAPAREAPAVTLPGLSPRGEKLLIGAVLLIGTVVAVGNSVRIHLADSRYAPERTVLDLERGVLRDGAEEIPLDGQAVGFIDWFGYVDRGARNNQDAMRVSGWGYDPAATGEALQVLVFDGSELLGVTRTGRARPDLQRTSSLPNVDLLFTGFELGLPRPPEWWPPKTEVNAVYLGPSGSASLARVTDPARRRMEAVPAGASGFYVYVDEAENALVYVRDECSEDDTAPLFFLHVVPVDKDDLPRFRRNSSFQNLDFHFRDQGFEKDGRCFAMMPLPDYGIAEIRTGQSIGGRVLWEEHLGAVPAFGLGQRAVPAFGFDVSVDETGNALIYARDECSEDDTAPLFFLHVVPVDKDDLPDVRRQYSYDNFDFHFHGSRKDGRCFVTMPLPDYDVAEIRTGQSIGGRTLWEERFTFDR